MSLLRKLPNKPRNPQLILELIVARFSTAPNTNPNPFPDHPTSAYYDDLINAAAASGDFETIRRALNNRIRDGCFNTSHTFKFLTNTSSSLSLLDDLRRTISRLDVGFPRKSGFDTLIARLCKLGRVDEALRFVAEDMAAPKGGCGVTVSTFYPILSVLTRRKEMEEAWRVAEVMRSMAVAADVTAYNYFLTSYCVKGEIGKAREVLKEMEREEISPDTRAYDALVLGACKAGKVEGAMVVLRRMEDDGVPILYSTHSHVIGALVRMGCYQQAVKFVMAYVGRDEKLDMESFGGLASKLIRRSRVEEAKLVVEEMAKRGMKMGTKLRDFYEMNVRD